MLSLLPASFPRRRESHYLVQPDSRLRGNDEEASGNDEVLSTPYLNRVPSPREGEGQGGGISV